MIFKYWHLKDEATYCLFSSHPLLHLLLSFGSLCSAGEILSCDTSFWSAALSSSGLFDRLGSGAHFLALRSSLRLDCGKASSLCECLLILAFPDLGGGVILLVFLFGDDRLSFLLGECNGGERDLDRDLFLTFALFTLISCFRNVSSLSCLFREPFISLPLVLLDFWLSKFLTPSSLSFFSEILFFSRTSSSFESALSCICLCSLGSFLFTSAIFECSDSIPLGLTRITFPDGDTDLDFGLSSTAELSFFGILNFSNLLCLSTETCPLFSEVVGKLGVTWLSFLCITCSFAFTVAPSLFNLGSLVANFSDGAGSQGLVCGAGTVRVTCGETLKRAGAPTWWFEEIAGLAALRIKKKGAILCFRHTSSSMNNVSKTALDQLQLLCTAVTYHLCLAHHRKLVLYF